MNIENSIKAIASASDFYKLILPTEQYMDRSIEGIEMTDKNYRVTLSYPEETGYLFAAMSKRHYNTFTINGENFEMISMGVFLGPDNE